MKQSDGTRPHPIDHNNYPGIFVVLEGLDGAGTTTQSNLLKNRLLEAGFGPVEVAPEPTGGPFGVICRQALQGYLTLDPYTLTWAFSADRADHVFGCDGILEHLRSERIELCDRYLYSTIAYQSVRVPMELTWRLNAAFPQPDLLVFLDVDVETCLNRLAERQDHPEVFENQVYLQQVDANYRKIFAEYDGHDWYLAVDGTQTPSQVLEIIWTKLFPMLSNK